MITQTTTVQQQLPLGEQWYEMSTAAKIINEGIGRNKLLQLLRDQRVLMFNNEPYQHYIGKKYFKVVLKDVYNRNSQLLFRQPVTLISEGGIFFVKNLIKEHKIKN